MWRPHGPRTAAQRLGKALEQETAIAEAKHRDEKAAKLPQSVKATPAAAPKEPAQEKATKETTRTDGTRPPREFSKKAIVVDLLSRADGATLEEIMAATAWQKHSVRGFISTLGSKHGLKISSMRRDADKARVYSIAK